MALWDFSSDVFVYKETRGTKVRNILDSQSSQVHAFEHFLTLTIESYDPNTQIGSFSRMPKTKAQEK